MEIFTGKNKENFEKWLNPTGFPSDYKYGQALGGNFKQLPFEMQIGVLLAYYDSLDIIISTEYNFGFVWRLLNVNEGMEDHCGGFESRPEAYKEAFIKANELANNQLKQ